MTDIAQVPLFPIGTCCSHLIRWKIGNLLTKIDDGCVSLSKLYCSPCSFLLWEFCHNLASKNEQEKHEYPVICNSLYMILQNEQIKNRGSPWELTKGISIPQFGFYALLSKNEWLFHINNQIGANRHSFKRNNINMNPRLWLYLMAVEVFKQ